jgi:hypothetical protein
VTTSRGADIHCPSRRSGESDTVAASCGSPVLRLQPKAARLLAEILERSGFPETAGRIARAIELQVTVEAPLTTADYHAIIDALGTDCPPTLYRLRRQLLEDQRYVRRVTGG